MFKSCLNLFVESALILFHKKTEYSNLLINEINRISNISLPNNLKPRISNPNPFVNRIYRKKKISDSRLIGKKSKNLEKPRDSSKTEDFHEIKAKNRQLILNTRPVIHLKIKQLQKIVKNDSLFYLLRFLDYFDIINLYKARNKQLCILLNTALANAYYFSIKEALLKYNNIIEDYTSFIFFVFYIFII